MKYTITDQDGMEIDTVAAVNAIEALNTFSADHIDDDYGFHRGGLNCDACTCGDEWANIRTDGGRISAAKVDDHE